MIWKVIIDCYDDRQEYIVVADTKSKANYQAYKEAKGDVIEIYCKFWDFMKYFHYKTTRMNV